MAMKFVLALLCVAAAAYAGDVADCEQSALAEFYSQCCILSSGTYLSADLCASNPIFQQRGPLCGSDFTASCPQKARVEDQVNPDAEEDFCLQDRIILESERGEVETSGSWHFSDEGEFYHGDNALTNAFNTGRQQRARFSGRYVAGGRYDVYMTYSRLDINYENVSVVVSHHEGVDTVLVDQSQPPQNDDGLKNWHYLGTYRFDGVRTEYVEVQTEGAGNNKLVWADAVRFERLPCTTAEPTTTEEPTTEAPTTEEPTTEEVTTAAPTTVAPTTEDVPTTEGQTRFDCIFDCKVQAAACRIACGPKTVGTIFCRVGCAADRYECEETCEDLPATAEPGLPTLSTTPGPSTTTGTARFTTTTGTARFTTTTRGSPETTTTRALPPTTEDNATRPPATSTTGRPTCGVPRTCRCKDSAVAVYFTDENGCQQCSCQPEGFSTTASAEPPRTTTTVSDATRPTDGTTASTAAPTSTTAAPSTSTAAASTCPPARDCRCKPGSQAVYGRDASGCSFCSCVADGSATTTEAPHTETASDAPATTEEATEAPRTTTASAAPPTTTAAPTTTQAPTTTTTTTEPCPTARVCNCKPGSESQNFIDASGCQNCRCVRV